MVRRRSPGSSPGEGLNTCKTAVFGDKRVPLDQGGARKSNRRPVRAALKTPCKSRSVRSDRAPPSYGGAPRGRRGLGYRKSLETKPSEFALRWPTNPGDRSWGQDESCDKNLGLLRWWPTSPAF